MRCREHPNITLKEVQFPHPGRCKLKLPTFHLSLQKATFLESTTHWSGATGAFTLNTLLKKTLSATASPESAISIQSCWHLGHFPLPLCMLNWFLSRIHEDSSLSFPACTVANAFMPSSQHPTIKSRGHHLTQKPAPTSEPTGHQGQDGGPQAAINTLQSPSFTAPVMLVWAWGAHRICVSHAKTLERDTTQQDLLFPRQLFSWFQLCLKGEELWSFIK